MQAEKLGLGLKLGRNHRDEISWGRAVTPYVTERIKSLKLQLRNQTRAN
jgi:hypothetical protein